MKSWSAQAVRSKVSMSSKKIDRIFFQFLARWKVGVWLCFFFDALLENPGDDSSLVCSLSPLQRHRKLLDDYPVSVYTPILPTDSISVPSRAPRPFHG